MIDTIYIESAVRRHPRAQAILKRYPNARLVECDRYQSVFNRRAQNFRVQKARPSLILAEKAKPMLYTVPGDQHLGAAHNYYFSHLLNCPFDCRYCFLQGMFSSANYVLFLNYEDFAGEIAKVCQGHEDQVHLFSGYDCDSLALEPLTGFAAHFVDAVAEIDNALLELRTKSTQIRSLLSREPHGHCVVAMSLAPDVVAERLEHGAPSLGDRLQALARLQTHGWPIGLRFDPLVPFENAASVYAKFIAQVMSHLDPLAVHSVTLGNLRLPREFGKRMFKLYPDEPLFAGPLRETNGTYIYRGAEEQDLLACANNALTQHISADRIFQQH